MGDQHHGHDHGLEHAPEHSLKWVLLMTGGFMIAEAVGGWLTNSLALISDAGHMLTDTAALAIALAAIHIGKRSADQKRTFGYARFEVLAAAFNAVILFLIAIYILYEAIDRFQDPPPLQSGAMMIIAVLGLLVNVVSVFLLRGGNDSSLNVKGAYLEVWSDMLGSVGVLLAGAIIHFTGWGLIDPIIAVLIGLWVLPRSWMILKASFNILLEGVPAGMNTDVIKATMANVAGVSGVHDLHVWAVTSGRFMLTAHVERDSVGEANDKAVLEALHKLLNDEFHIAHSTLQLEHDGCGTTPCSDLETPASAVK